MARKKMITAVAAGLLALTAARGARPPEKVRPVDLAFASGRIFVLGAAGGIYEFKRDAKQVVPLGRLSHSYKSIALTAVPVGGQLNLLASYHHPTLGVVASLDLQDRKLNLVPLRSGRVVGGLAVDGERGLVYLMESRRSTVIVASLRGLISGQAPGYKTVAILREATSGGAILFDAAGQRLYVSDPIEGRIYRLDLAASGRARPKAIGRRTPGISGLALSHDRQTLYVADPQAGRVWRLAAADGSRKTPLEHGEFKNPSGVVVDEQGTVWVADQDEASLFEFSSSGDFVAVHHLDDIVEGQTEEVELERVSLIENQPSSLSHPVFGADVLVYAEDFSSWFRPGFYIRIVTGLQQSQARQQGVKYGGSASEPVEFVKRIQRVGESAEFEYLGRQFLLRVEKFDASIIGASTAEAVVFQKTIR